MMRWIRKISLGFLIPLSLMIVGLGIFFLIRATEPHYGGKSLRAWVRDLDGYAAPKMHLAQEAIGHIGNDAIPYTLRLLRTRDTPLKTEANKWLAKQSWIKFRFSPAKAQWVRGLFACEALGTNAYQLIPELTAMVYNPEVARHAAYVLTGFGPQATPILTNVAAHVDSRIRFAAIISMARLNDRSIVPFLLRHTKDLDGEVRTAAIEVLAFVAEDPAIAIPALITGLQDPDKHVRSAAAYGLGHWVQHPQAKEAVPFLAQAFRDAAQAPAIDILASHVRRNAGNTLRKLDPEMAATVGVPTE